MAINIITYSGKTRTAKHDAMVYDAALDRSGVFNGCDVTANGNVVTVSSGYGIIKGRVFEVAEEGFPVTLPGSGTTYGALIVTLDLSDSVPLKLETITSTSKTFNLTKNENVNFINGRYQMLLATYSLTLSGVTNIVKAAHMLPADSIGSNNVNDYVESGVYYLTSGISWVNLPSGVKNGWLAVYDNKTQKGDSAAVKQVFWRYGTADTQHETYIRTKISGLWQKWTKLVTFKDLTTGIPTNLYVGNNTREGGFISLESKRRHIGLLLSDAGNAGIFDPGYNEWILYSDKNGDVRIPHKLVVSEFAPGTIAAGDATSASDAGISVRNKYRRIGLFISSAENAGIFDYLNSRWIIVNRKTNETVFPAAKVNFDAAPIHAPKSIARGVIFITATKANTPVYKDVTWPEMGGTPSVSVTAGTSVPQNVSVSITNVTSTGCRICMSRSDATASAGATGIHYVAIYTY